MSLEGYGVDRVRSDGLEEAEQRLTLFQVPNRLPIGRDRSRMSRQEFARRAAPALQDAFQHEQAVKDIISDQARPKYGSEAMASIAFNQKRRDNHDDWGIDRIRNIDPNAEFAAMNKGSQDVARLFDDNFAAQQMDGRGDGRGHRIKHAQGLTSEQAMANQRKLIPTSAIIGANAKANWVVDRDQRGLEYASDPAVLERAAENAVENTRAHDANRIHSRRSAIPMGDHDLNPGGHRLNANIPRADDYGIARMRTEQTNRPQEAGQVAALLHDPDPRAPFPVLSPTNPYAGRSQRSTVQLNDHQVAEAPYRGPYAGRRAKSVVFEERDGASAPPLPQGAPGVAAPGYFIGHDVMGGPTIKHNEHYGKMTDSRTMEHYLKFDPSGHADEVGRQHARRRQQMPSNAKRVPIIEDVVFDNHPVTRQQHLVHVEPSIHAAQAEGKRSVYSGLMPAEALKAVQSQIGPRELGGDATAQHPNAPPPPPDPKKALDNKEMLHYAEHADADRRVARPRPPPVPYSAVGESINGGEVAPDAYSAEPRGLPRRHPGPERLKRGKGVDGQGHDHQGRQLATSLVDEVIFGRANFQGRIPLANNGVNFGLNQAGEFGHR